MVIAPLFFLVIGMMENLTQKLKKQTPLFHLRERIMVWIDGIDWGFFAKEEFNFKEKSGQFFLFG